MARNVFALRTSEQSFPDGEFTRNFAPGALQVLPADVLKPGALVIRSSPGGGKTSLLRIFTPGPLVQAVKHRNQAPYDEIFAALEDIDAVTKTAPKIVGIYVSSNGGYREIAPSNPPEVAPGLFRALLNARIVLRTLRAVSALAELDYDDEASLKGLRINASRERADIGQILDTDSAQELKAWAEKTEVECLRHLDTVIFAGSAGSLPLHTNISAIRWLATTRFVVNGTELPYRPLLMFDDLQRLRPWQRAMLFAECVEHRTSLMVWLAEQTKVLDPQDVLNTAKSERDHTVIDLEKEWANQPKKFEKFATAIADQRLRNEELQIATSLSNDLSDSKLQPLIAEALATLRGELAAEQKRTARYDQWVAVAEEEDLPDDFARAIVLGKVGILIARDRNKRQQSFDLDPLPGSDLDASGISAASERMITQRFKLPYYFGIERMARLASCNIEEFLQLCAGLFDLIHAARVLRNKRTPMVTAADQDAVVRSIAGRRFSELSRSVAHGEMAKKLVQAVGTMAKERTYEPNAPYAPGVTGFAIPASDRVILAKALSGENALYAELASVLTSCVVNNVFDMKEVKHDGRQFTVFYLNRTLCAHFDLVYHQGGWQRVTLRRLVEWCQGYVPSHQGRIALQ